MPLYDFGCNACGALFEELIFEESEKPPCQECGSLDTARRISAPSPLKTNPFPYKIDNKRKAMPSPAQMSKLNRSCPNAASCGASASIGGGSGG